MYAQDNNFLPVWSHKFVLSSPTHISTNSRPFLVGIVSQYAQTAVKNVEAYLKSEDSKRWKISNTTYRPEFDVSRELNVADAAYYQSLIGILRWIVELG